MVDEWFLLTIYNNFIYYLVLHEDFQFYLNILSKSISVFVSIPVN